jgi:hypothetical protein
MSFLYFGRLIYSIYGLIDAVSGKLNSAYFAFEIIWTCGMLFYITLGVIFSIPIIKCSK